jgi:hypothetical protein
MPIVIAEAIQDENSDPRLAWSCHRWLGKQKKQQSESA